MVTVALGTNDPDESATLPKMAVSAVWALRIDVPAATKTKADMK
jgi:hypothetical protein